MIAAATSVSAATAATQSAHEKPANRQPVPPPMRNLVGNPGFELAKPEPWSLTGTGASLTENGARSGRAALHLVPGTRAEQTLRRLEPGALYVARGWLQTLRGMRAQMTYAEAHKERNGKHLVTGLLNKAMGTGKYELATLLFRPELDQASSRGAVDVKFSLYTEDDKGEALMDDIEIRRAELVGPDLLGAVQFDQKQLERWKPGTTEPVIVRDGGPGGEPCLRLMKKGEFTLLLDGLEPNATYAATAWVRGYGFRFGAREFGYLTGDIWISSTTSFVSRTIGFTTGPKSSSASLYFKVPGDGRQAFIDSVEVRRVELR